MSQEHDTQRETTGERLVRIETLLQGLDRNLQQHIKDEEKELMETRRIITDHISSQATLTGDLAQVRRDVHDVQQRVKAIEGEVANLIKNKTFIVAWASGAASVITLLGTAVIWLASKFFGA